MLNNLLLQCLCTSSAHMKSTKTAQYREAVQRSQKRQEGQTRLSHELWWAQYRYTRGHLLATQIQDGTLKFDDLDSDKQELVEAFETRRSARELDRLLQQKRPPYRGAGPAVGP